MGDSEEKARVTELLRHFFQPRPFDLEEVEENDVNDTKQLESWVLKDSNKVVSWTAIWAAHTAHLTLATSFSGDITDPMCIDMESRIVDLDHETNDVIKIICSSTRQNPYNFSIAIDLRKTPFEVVNMLESLEASFFDEIKSTLKTEILEKKWNTKNRGPLKAKALAFKLRNVINSMTQSAIVVKGKFPLQRVALEGSGVTATNSQVQSRTTNRVDPASPRIETTTTLSSDSLAKGKKRSAPTKKTEDISKKKNKLFSEEDLETALNDNISSIPKAMSTLKEIDYTNTNLIYQKFFSDCQDAFIFKKPTQKMEIDVMRIKEAPVDWTFGAFEDRGLAELTNYLINMPDKS